MIPRRSLAVVALTLLTFTLSLLQPNANADTPGSSSKIVREFVSDYAVIVEQTSDASGKLKLTAAVADYSRMGKRLSRGCDSIDGLIRAAGNDVWFRCGGTDVVITNLSVADAEARGDLASEEPTTYAQWAAAFSATDLSDAVADGDSDGISNLLEYALGLDASVANGGRGLMQVEPETIGGEQFLTLRYTSDLSKSDVSVSVEASADLTSGSWTDEGIDDLLVSTGGKIEKRMARIKLSEGRSFLRIVAHQR